MSGEKQCGYGRCVPEHPLHCCHTAKGYKRKVGPKTAECGWRCLFCAKRSKAVAIVRDFEEPRD